MTRADTITMAKLKGHRRLNSKEQKRARLLGVWMAYQDECRLRVRLQLDQFYHLIFVLPMPLSWSNNKRDEHLHGRHLCRPDKDNLEKGLLDALFAEDCTAWDGRVTKVWGEQPAIIVSSHNLDVSPAGIDSILGKTQ